MVLSVPRGELVEHWWNDCWGGPCRDVHLYRDGGEWIVVVVFRRTAEFPYPGMTEVQARAYVSYLLRTAPMPPDRQWREISAAHRGAARTSADSPDPGAPPGRRATLGP